MRVDERVVGADSVVWSIVGGSVESSVFVVFGVVYSSSFEWSPSVSLPSVHELYSTLEKSPSGGTFSLHVGNGMAYSFALNGRSWSP